MALARYGYSVGATISPSAGAGVAAGLGPVEAPPNDDGPATADPDPPGAAPPPPMTELRCTALMPLMPPTGDVFSRPLSWADVYICGGCTGVDVSGRLSRYGACMAGWPGARESLLRANESMKARGTAEGAEPK